MILSGSFGHRFDYTANTGLLPWIVMYLVKNKKRQVSHRRVFIGGGVSPIFPDVRRVKAIRMVRQISPSHYLTMVVFGHSTSLLRLSLSCSVTFPQTTAVEYGLGECEGVSSLDIQTDQNVTA